MSGMNRFIDYFIVSGLDVTSGLEPDTLAGDRLHCPPLDRPFKSRVLSHYPEKATGTPFDSNAVAMLSHPKGLRFQTQKGKREPHFHSYITTREDGSRSYGAALTFYESVDAPQIISAMQTLQNMHMAELSNAQSRTLYSRLSEYEQSPKRSHKPDVKTIGRIYDCRRDTLFVTKCISVMSSMPLIATFERILAALLEATQRDAPLDLPLESYVYNLLFEVPLPPPGRSMRVATINQTLICQRPGVTELPLHDYPLRDLFDRLGVENLIDLFTCVLLERQILLYSQDYQILMTAAEGVTSLIFPFTWQHVYVPILPASLLHFLDAPVPFIMGLHHSNDGQQLMQHCAKANMCFCDVDSGKLELPEDFPVFPYRQALREEIELYLIQCTNSLNGHLRDSGFRDSYAESEFESASSSTWSLSGKLEMLQQNEALAKITALAKRTGVISSLEDISELARDPSKLPRRQTTDRHVKELIFNNTVREIFLNYFMHIFNTYESFIIQPSQEDMDQWLTNRDSMQNFDKMAFLVDQPPSHLPFLSAFIESQMFATFIDNKIIAQWEDADPYTRIFDIRLRTFRERTEDDRILQQHRHSMCKDNENVIERRASHVDLVAPSPHELDGIHSRHYKPGFFPQLADRILKKEPPGSKTKRQDAKWRKKDRGLHHSEHLGLNSDQREKYIQEARGKSVRQPKFSDMNPAAMVQTNWKFVETLLKECKAKTKRMLVDKMGQEAVELGHGDQKQKTQNVEENTLIASLCDLLERIWSHGLQNKQGKSALWQHLLRFQEAEEKREGGAGVSGAGGVSPRDQTMDPNMLGTGPSAAVPRGYATIRSRSHTPDPARPGAAARAAAAPRSLSSSRTPSAGAGGTVERSVHSRLLQYATLNARTAAALSGKIAKFNLSGVALESDDCPSGTQTWPVRRHRRKASRGNDLPELKSLPVSVTYDMRMVQRMGDMKTEVGYARAWVRLALEKKLLSRHLKELMSNPEILRREYKRYAFLRCEDEREQFLFHLLSLNAVDYYCFTNTFTQTVIPYRVLIFPRQKTSANCWFSLAGQTGETPHVSVAKHTLDYVYEHKNLGILTTLRIGHDNAGMTPKWMVEHILVRNECTGQTYRFPCGRWLGKGVDDGSIERLLVAEPVPSSTNAEELMEKCRTPPRCRSPSMPRRASESRLQISEVQEMLGDAVNNLVKHFYKPEKERGSITGLLCGEFGLVYCMEQVFQIGFKSSRVFRNNLFTWDFLERILSYFDSVLSDDERYELSHEGRQAMLSYCHVVSRINESKQSMGKDGRFQIFICIGVRDHWLQRWVHIMSHTPTALTMYEEKSFLRDPNLNRFLVEILGSLNEFRFDVETSLVKGVKLS